MRNMKTVSSESFKSLTIQTGHIHPHLPGSDNPTEKEISSEITLRLKLGLDLLLFCCLFL